MTYRYLDAALVYPPGPEEVEMANAACQQIGATTALAEQRSGARDDALNR